MPFSIIFAPRSCKIFADVAKLADASDLGSDAARHGGSIPFIRTLSALIVGGSNRIFQIITNKVPLLGAGFMATVTRENIGLLNDKIIVQVSKEDYISSFEKSLKGYAKTASIAGFRKGMVPSGVVKKMYGQSVFADEVIKSVEKELQDYVEKEQLDIFAQPLPLPVEERMLDMNNPGDYDFAFEIGLRPKIEINVAEIKVSKFKVKVTDEMISDEINRLKTRHGKLVDREKISNDEELINVTFRLSDAEGNLDEKGIEKQNSLLVKYFTADTKALLMGKEVKNTIVIQLNKAFDEKEREWLLQDLGLDKNSALDGDKYFNLLITKIGFVEKAEMVEVFYNTVFPGRGIINEEEFKNAVKVDIENHFENQSRNQLQDQIYHHLIDHTNIDFPEGFLKRWIQMGGEKPLTAEDAEVEYPKFANSLKWSLISTKLLEKNEIIVAPEEIKQFALNQVSGYMGIQNFEEAPWLEEYANKMMQDKKFVENTYMQIQTNKLFHQLETEVIITEEEISAEDLASKMHHHHH